MISKNFLIATTVILTLIFIILIVVYFVLDSEYKNLINNESSLCPTANCAYASENCGVLPFKIVDNQVVCAQSAFMDAQPNVALS